MPEPHATHPTHYTWVQRWWPLVLFLAMNLVGIGMLYQKIITLQEDVRLIREQMVTKTEWATHNLAVEREMDALIRADEVQSRRLDTVEEVVLRRTR